jgi:pre-60S factor REI1
MNLKCNTCKLVFEDRVHLDLHYRSEFHRQNLINQSKKIPILSQSGFDSLKAETKEEPKDPEIKTSVEICRDIPESECLFCGKIFDSFDICFEHMSIHNFRIAFPDNLKNKDGLFTFLREKIGIGHCCLLCSKQFSSIKAVRNHMIDLHHGQYDAKDVEEFYEFEDMELPEVDSLGLMHLLDGTVLGHRMYQRYYKQNPVNLDELKKVIRIPICGPCLRQTIDIARDKHMQETERINEKIESKRTRRLVSKHYHPFSDIHRGNA